MAKKHHCATLTYDDILREKPGSVMKDFRDMHRLPHNKAITTADSVNGVRIEAYKRGEVKIFNNGADVMNKNAVQLIFGKDGNGYSPWYWLLKGGWCTAPYDYLDLSNGTVYVLEKYGN